MSPEVIAAFIGAVGAIIIAILGSFGAKRLGIGVNQERLVGILKDTVSAQKDQIAELQKSDVDKDGRIKKLEDEVYDLKELNISQAKRLDVQAKEIEVLNKRRVRPRATEN